ncbi:16S rRNA (guanine1207-N2)-methyltransferase [Planifilum fulgidum]|uniref:16S rRNA (Guanine1207-N2)-methyltransferase n=1 Tax=Planifilum fulgidum TaxID=201973 RepID=A0A1I2QD87_9BACL|nr:class I SAM-dependent methyltransferase [Planifilum fulgidum]MBO2495897.1 class I SAM-dependent methyltransferase [Bacillota bacterium]MBO2533996.1 class I SAM-dependent methyltransferase [Thermoactinomycetaceae bacterium]SFG23726.1 16S rRNA (guanine1207-N2)-methyltransferase [Planifilum fulgidum]
MDDRWEHYFTSRPETSGDERLITARLRGDELRFWTDAGVFSRRGIDFGTRLLIETVRLPETGEILDLGCGYGPVGIACAKAAPSCRVTMVDVNQRALRLAEKNARLNGVSARVTILESDGLCALSDRLFDAVLINPPIRAGKAVVYRLFAEAAEHLRPGGSLWAVIRKKQGAESAKRELAKHFRNVTRVEQKKGYWILKADR